MKLIIFILIHKYSALTLKYLDIVLYVYVETPTKVAWHIIGVNVSGGVSGGVSSGVSGDVERCVGRCRPSSGRHRHLTASLIHATVQILLQYFRHYIKNVDPNFFIGVNIHRK